MKVDSKSMLLYIVTDRTWLGDKSFTTQIEDTLKAGGTFLQLREKDMASEEFITEAIKVQALAKKYNVPFVINDNIDVAIAAGADGVHIGQDDMTMLQARQLMGDEKIIGVSVQSVKQAVTAERDGADYIGVGAVFSTSTKLDATSVSYDELKNICKSVSIPVVAIGGINEKNIPLLKGSGINGIAVISAIFAKDNIFEAAKAIHDLANEVVA